MRQMCHTIFWSFVLFICEQLLLRVCGWCTLKMRHLGHTETYRTKETITKRVAATDALTCSTSQAQKLAKPLEQKCFISYGKKYFLQI